ncbi:transporter substrate-binding domain-containing protein [Vibrio sp. AK197]
MSIRQHSLLWLLVVGLLLPSRALSNQPSIELSTLEWAPYTGRHLPELGFMSEVTSQAFSHMGYDVTIRFRPWLRALQEAKEGKVDGVIAIYKNTEREQYLTFSHLVWEVKEMLITLAEHPMQSSQDIHHLNNLTVGVLRGSLSAEDLRQDGVRVSPVTNEAQNIRKLYAKRLDAIITPKEVFNYNYQTIKETLPSHATKLLKPAYKSYPLHVAFGQHNPNHGKLVEDFNRGLAIIKDNGIFASLVEKHHMQQD